MMQPLVSVLIPAYNHERYIQEAIHSVAKQSYQNIEIIVIDDGSTDNTFTRIKELAQRYKDRFPRFYYRTQNNAGVIETLNALLDQANGEYVYIMASDDVAASDAVNVLVEYLERHSDYALVVGDNRFIDENSQAVYWGKSGEIIRDKSHAEHLTFSSVLKCKKLGDNFGRYLYLYWGNHIPNGYLIRKSIFDKTGHYIKNAPLEDWYMNLQIAKYAKMKYVDTVLFSYRCHSSNTVKNKEHMHKITDLTFEYENELLKSLPEKELSQDMKDCLKYGRNRNKFTLIPRFIELRSIRKGNKKNRLLRLGKWDIVF